MLKYILKRIGLAFLTAFIILSLTFILLKALPFQKPIGTEDSRYAYYEDQVNQGFCVCYNTPHEELGEALFVYQPIKKSKTMNYYYVTPIMNQYFSFLKNIVTRWDWGTSVSIQPNVKALYIIRDRLPVTIKINILSVIFSVPLGILLGIFAALQKNKLSDHIISTLIMVFISIPSFVLITFLMLIFCYRLNWLPSTWPSINDPASQKALGYVLPVFCLSFGSICGYCRFTRAELCEVMSSEYLLLARTKGLTKSQAITRHALKNAMVPIVPSILAEVVGILGGSMILEGLYNIPGMGGLFIDSLQSNPPDYSVLFVDMAIFTTISLLAGVLLDISYGFIDPRIRMGGKK